MPSKIFSLYLTTLLLSLIRCQNENICLKESFNEEPNLAIGSRNFKELVTTSNVFVDKSLFIKEILEDNTTTVLITYPRKWGKTINLSMLKNFLEIPVTQHGFKIPQTRTSNYKLFKLGEIINDTDHVEKFNPPLLISKHDQLFKTHQGKYPVVYVDFNGVGGENVLKEVKHRLSDGFRDHAYVVYKLHNLTKEPDIDEHELKSIKSSIKMFLNIANRNTEGKDMTKSLVFLCELLYEHFQRPVYVLMNDYDALIRDVLFDPRVTRKSEPEILKFFSSLMRETFHTNAFLKRGIITGIYLMDHFMPELNTTKHYNFVNNTLRDYFGFNRTEVDKLFQLFQISQDHIEQSIYWYKAYNPSKRYIEDEEATTASRSTRSRLRLESTMEPLNYTRKKKIKIDTGIYNPWTILNYVEHGGEKRHNFWVKTGNINFFRNIVSNPLFKDLVLDLFNEKRMQFKERSLFFHREEFWHLMNVFFVPDHKHKITWHTIDLTLAYLWTNGYLTFSRHAQNATSVKIDVKIPNEEVRNGFQEIAEMAEFGRTF